MKIAHKTVYKFHFIAVKYSKPDLTDKTIFFLACVLEACMLQTYKLKKHDKKVRLSLVFFLHCAVFIFIWCNYFRTSRVGLVFASHLYESLPCRHLWCTRCQCLLIKFIHILYDDNVFMREFIGKISESNQCVWNK